MDGFHDLSREVQEEVESMTLSEVDWGLLISILTPIITAITTASMTAKANERVLRNIMERVEDLEERIFNHERRISRLEGREVKS